MISDTPLPIVYLSQKNHLDYGNNIQEAVNIDTGELSPVDSTLYKDTLLHFL
jgi:hypothetical protein